MSTRVRWQDIYAVKQDIDSPTLRDHVAETLDFDRDTDVGIRGTGDPESGVFGMPLNEHVDFNAPSSIVETEQARGISQRHRLERITAQTGDPVEVALPFNTNAYNGSLFGYSLFQSGAEEDTIDDNGDPRLNRLICLPYSEADPEVWLSMYRAMQPEDGSDDVDPAIRGAVCSQIEFSGEMGGLLNMEATVRGALWEQADLSAQAPNVDFVGDIIPFRFQDMDVAMWDPEAEEWVEVFIPSFNITISNDIQFNFYNDPAAANALLDQLSVEGSLTVPWSQPTVGTNHLINAFLEGETRRLAFFWGRSGQEFNGEDYLLDDPTHLKTGDEDIKNYMSIFVNARITEYETVGDNEHQVQASLEGLYDGENNAAELRFAYDADLLERK